MDGRIPFKKCPDCQEWKDISDFHRKDKYRCYLCDKSYNKMWADKNREKIAQNQITYSQTVNGRANVLRNAALKRARTRGENFNLPIEHIQNGLTKGTCEKTGLKFDLQLISYRELTQRSINPLSPSIDKIDPFGIYEPSNVQYVCSWYNLAKGQMSDAELYVFCKHLVTIHDQSE